MSRTFLCANCGWTLFKCCIVFMMFQPVAVLGQAIVTPPHNATGKIGGYVSFECEVEFGVTKTLSWDFNDHPVYIFQYGLEDYLLSHEKYTVTRKRKTFKLTVNNLDFDDGGQFTCSTDKFREMAELIVLDTPSIYRSSDSLLERNMAMYICEAWFGGPPTQYISSNHYPDLQISFPDDPGGKEIIQLAPKHQGNYNLISKVVFVSLEARINGTQFDCEIRTRNPYFAVSKSYVINIDFIDSGVQTISSRSPTVTETLTLTNLTETYLLTSDNAYGKVIVIITAVLLCFIIGCSLFVLYYRTGHRKKLTKSERCEHISISEWSQSKMASNETEQLETTPCIPTNEIWPEKAIQKINCDVTLTNQKLHQSAVTRNHEDSQNQNVNICTDVTKNASMDTMSISSSEAGQFPYKTLNGREYESSESESQPGIHLPMRGYRWSQMYCYHWSPQGHADRSKGMEYPQQNRQEWKDNDEMNLNTGVGINGIIDIFSNCKNGKFHQEVCPEHCEKKEPTATVSDAEQRRSWLPGNLDSQKFSTEKESKWCSTQLQTEFEMDLRHLSQEDCNEHKPNYVLSVKESIRCVIDSCNQLREENESYISQLEKAYIARGIIAMVETALSDWLYPSNN